jgi:hypothetical protein
MSRVFGPVTQNGYIVRDLDAAVHYWTMTLGIGPFYVVPRLTFESYTYRGIDCMPEIRIALANSGGLQIELIQPLNDEHSYYKDFLEKNGSGLQHISVWSRSHDQDLERFRQLGLTAIVQCVISGGVRASFYGDESKTGAVVEVLDLTPPMNDIFTMIRAAAVGWDGANPVRTLQ